MPCGDRTGPAGMRPMTGRSAGFCAGFSVPGYANPVGRRGMGNGPGQRRWPRLEKLVLCNRYPRMGKSKVRIFWSDCTNSNH